MRTTFNNIYTPCLRRILTGKGYTPPSGKFWEDMVEPFKWEVYRYEHRKKYEQDRRLFIKKNPTGEFPEYVPLPDEADEVHQLPSRTANRSNFFTYFMVGPMAEGLYGLKTAFHFDVLHTPNTVDRHETSRKSQRDRKKADRLTYLHSHTLTHPNITHSLIGPKN